MAEPALPEMETPVWFGHVARGTYLQGIRGQLSYRPQRGRGKETKEQSPSERLLVNLGGEAIAKGERSDKRAGSEILRPL